MKVITFIISLLLVINLYGGNSRNGYQLPTGPGTIRLFIVYAELINDTTDRGDLMGWHTGQMPPFANDIVDSSFTTVANIHGYITKYFYEASLGKLKVLGNYYPSVVQFDFNTFPSNNKSNVDSVIYKFANYFNAISGTQIPVSGNKYFPTDFDKWSLVPGGNVHQPSANNYIDVFAVIWRNNSKYIPERNGGNLWLGQRYLSNNNILGKHIDVFTMMCDEGSLYKTLRHEFAHGLLGSNDFHSGGGNGGTKTFMEDRGGYSLLGAGWNNNLPFVNGWDRYRLGWKPDSTNLYIRSLNNSSQLVNTDLTYKGNFPNNSNEFVLRDFATTGDAVRIKLPYVRLLNTTAKEQWLWIENHQLKAGSMDEMNSQNTGGSMPKGIRMNIQIGNEDFTDFSSQTSYITPLHPFGSYDIVCDSTVKKGGGFAKIDSTFLNPFTGTDLTTTPQRDTLPNDNILKLDERYQIDKVMYNGSEWPSSYFNYLKYPFFGTKFDAYTVGQTTSISSNPAPVSRLSYLTYESSSPQSSAAYTDNRFIYLNGISIEILEHQANGNIKIRVRWNNFDVNKDVRWCGPIILKDTIYLKANKTITLDQGLTPTKPVNPITFKGQKVFADPTTFSSKTGSLFRLEAGSNVVVKNNSAMIFESGSKLEINSGAKLSIKSGSTLQIKSGDTLIIKGNGQINVESGGYICIESGATIILQDATSFINLQTGFNSGTNPTVIPSSTCVSAASATKTGNGQINDYNTDLYIQNQTISSGKYYAGKNIYVAGTGGAVLINNNASVTFDAAQDVFFQNGFEVATGAAFEVVKH